MECAICIGPIRYPLELRCKHKFCESCIYKYEKKGGSKCPCCRSPFIIRTDMTLDDQLILLKLKSKSDIYDDVNVEYTTRYSTDGMRLTYRHMRLIYKGRRFKHSIICEQNDL